MRECTIDGLFAIGVRASEGYVPRAGVLARRLPSRARAGRQTRNHGLPVRAARDLHGVRPKRAGPATKGLQGLDTAMPQGLHGAARHHAGASARPVHSAVFPAGEWHGPRVRRTGRHQEGIARRRTRPGGQGRAQQGQRRGQSAGAQQRTCRLAQRPAGATQRREPQMTPIGRERAPTPRRISSLVRL